MADNVQEYVYRHAIIAGQDAWKWQQKGTTVWVTTATERDADQQIHEDAAKRDLTPRITDISIFRPAGLERPEGHFWQVPGASEALTPERKVERRQERQQQQDRDGLGFSL